MVLPQRGAMATLRLTCWRKGRPMHGMVPGRSAVGVDPGVRLLYEGTLHGLTVTSQIPVPLFALVDTGSSADVRIERGPVLPDGEVLWEAPIAPRCRCLRQGDEIIMDWDAARFAVRRDRIVVDAQDEAVMRQLLIQPVWAVLLTARGRQALHACAVERDNRAVAVAGTSRSGKSTSALALINQGWRLLTDDLLTFERDTVAYPGPPYMRLRADRAAGLAGGWDELGKLCHAPRSCQQPVPVETIIILDAQFSGIQRLFGLQAADVLLRHVYHPIRTHVGQAVDRLDFAMHLAASVTVFGAPPRTLTPSQLAELATQGDAP